MIFRFLVFFLLNFPFFIISQENSLFGIKTVVIDPGHGGKDPGNLGTGRYKITEKDITLDVSLILGDYIKTYFPEINIIYTRQSDEFVKLSKRAELANLNNADLFISIHCDAFTHESASGSSTYVMGPHKTESNLKIAMMENSSILMEDNFDVEYGGFDPNEPESYIALCMYQSEHMGYGLNFASKIQHEFGKSEKRKNRGVKQAGFLVISRTTMPSVLVEIGFLTNNFEEDYLISEKGKNEVAFSIFEAFKNYKQELDVLSINRMNDIAEKDTTENIIKNNDQRVETFLSVQFFASKDSIDFNNSQLDKNLVFCVKENSLFKYFFGKAFSYSEAKVMQKKMKNSGFFDSFIVGFFEKNKADLSKVLSILEKKN